MIFNNAQRLLLCAFTVSICWLVFTNSQAHPANDQKNVISDWCKKDARLVANIAEASSKFVSEPNREKEKLEALIGSYHAWHSFWCQPEIDNWEMTEADCELMQKRTDNLIAVHRTFWKEAHRRILSLIHI